MTALGDDFTVVLDGIRTGSEQARAAGEGAGAVKLGELATSIAGALRGTRSATSAGELATAWDAAVASLSADLKDHSRRLADSATVYEDTERAVETSFSSTGPDRAI